MISGVPKHIEPARADESPRPERIAGDAGRSIIEHAVTAMLRQLGQRQPVLEPFRHAVADGLLDASVLRRVAAGFPQPASPLWFGYDSPLEKKLCCNRIDHLSSFVGGFVNRLNTSDVAAAVGRLFGIEGLVVDPSLHGGGLHMIEPGGKLDIHLDFSDHPKLPLTRRVNMILYLNEFWQDAWRGHLELWDPALTRCVVRIAPRFNRLVLFEVHDQAYHGHPEPLASPSGTCRQSIALYFLTPRHRAEPERPRAHFVRVPNDPDDALDTLRRQRASLQTDPLKPSHQHTS
jgi:hypothetical protein